MQPVSNWTEQYQHFIDNPPQEGDILTTITSDAPARLDLEFHEGKPPFVYGRAYVPCIVGEALGWFLQPVGCENAHGLKCILLPKAREELLRKRGVRNAIISVKSLRVVRWSQTKQSLLCEVADYGDDVVETESTLKLEQTAEAVVEQPLAAAA